MTQQKENTGFNQILEIINKYGMDGLADAVSVLLNEAMKAERCSVLNAQPWERSESRTGYANGYKNKTLASRFGNLSLKIPQVRGDIEFYPSALDKGLRSEGALKIALAEMYVQGVSTRKVSAILEKMCGLEVSSTQVCNAAKLLDEELEKWRNRPIWQLMKAEWFSDFIAKTRDKLIERLDRALCWLPDRQASNQMGMPPKNSTI